MIFDGRNIEVREVLLRLKEALTSCIGEEVSIDILLKELDDVRRVKAFASMSGCVTAIEGRDGYYLLRIRGNVCCV